MFNQLKLQQILDQVLQHLPLLSEDAQSRLKKSAEEFSNEMLESQYIKVPLVGVFDAGKSSLLNVFTQKPGMLPVDTVPETAVAYELYYGNDNIVELYRDGRKIDAKPLADIKQLNTQPGDIAKVYCDSHAIKACQDRGIILVDMPGIGSGIERHDAAIFNYIHSGTAFVLLVDAEQGSLRSSTLTFMQELSQYNLHPAVIVTKIDRKPESEIKTVVEYIEYQLKKLGDNQPYISSISAVDNNIAGFAQYLDSLDAEALFNEKFGKRLSLLIDNVIKQLKVRVELRGKDVDDVEGKLRAIETEIANVRAELPIGTNADTPEKSARDVLDNVRAALIAKSDEIAQMIFDKADQEEIKSLVVSTVRAEIISSLKEESEQYSAAMSDNLQEAAENLGIIEIDTGIFNDFDEIINMVSAIVSELMNLGGIWGQIAKILMPFVGDILRWFFGKSDSQVLEEIRDQFLTKCVDHIAVDLMPTIIKLTIDNQTRIKAKLQEELVAKMESVKDGLREKIADANKSKETILQEIQHLDDAVKKLEALKASIN